MDWHESAIVLGVRPHGENDLIAALLTRTHGRYLGLVHGGRGRRSRGVYQPGNLVMARWRARISEQLGHFTAELLRADAARHFADPLALAALASATSLIDGALPERDPHAALFDALATWIAQLGAPGWIAAYIRLELTVLAEIGYGLDLGRCAATGRNDDLAYVSPRTGRAVSLSAGEPWRDKLLPLPAFLTHPSSDEADPDPVQIAQALRLTGHFLDAHFVGERGKNIPPARARLVDRLSATPVLGPWCGQSPDGTVSCGDSET